MIKQILEIPSSKSLAKKILFVCSGNFPNGTDGETTLVKTYSRGFTKQGDKVAIFSLRLLRSGMGYNGIIEEGTFEYCRRQEQKNTKFIIKVLRYVVGIFNIVKAFVRENQKRRINLVLLYQVPFDFGFVFVLLAKFQKIKIAYIYADWINYSVKARLTRKTFYRLPFELLGPLLLPHLTKNSIVLSDFLKRQLLGFNVKPKSILKVRSIVDCDRFKPDIQPHPEILSLKKDRFCVMYMGSFLPHQGIDTLIDAGMKLFCDKGAPDNIFFLLVGDYHSGAGKLYKSRIEQIGLGKKIVMFGAVSFDTVPSILAGADVLITPRDDSRESVSAGPMKIAEYLAMAKPVIVSDVGDITCLARNNIDLVFCEAGDPQSIVDSILCLYKDKNLQDRISLNGRTLAKEKFLNTLICREILDFVFREDF